MAKGGQIANVPFENFQRPRERERIGDHHANDTKRKILSLDAISKALEPRRRGGESIVLCHGTFDLLHVGHLRHLKAAHRYGDVLVVSITADEFVNKGPNRPVFPAALRAEMLAELELVDFVAVVHAPSGAPAISAMRPDYYVKGREYADFEKDITGKIATESELVKSFGGRLVFTNEVTYSSSNLLNKHFVVTDEATQRYLDGLRRTGFEERLTQLLAKIEAMRVVMIGETIIDRYVYVDAMGKAAKENIIATLHRGEEAFAGGVVAAANHLAALCPNVELVTLLGNPSEGEDYEALVRDSLASTIRPNIIWRPEGPTVQKTRFVEPTYVRKLFEVYRMNDEPLPLDLQARFHQLLRDKIAEADLVILCDFGHGFIAPSTARLLEQQAPFFAVNAQSNAGNIGFNLVTKYRRADFVCIDALEARLAAGNKHAPLPQIVNRLRAGWPDCANLIVTNGKDGCYVAQPDEREALHIPAVNGHAVDTVGAGDAFFVLAAPFLAASGDCETAGFLGNVAGAIKVGIVGHRRSLSKLELQRYVSTLLK